MLDNAYNPTPLPSIQNQVIRAGVIWGAGAVLISLIGYVTDTDPSMPGTDFGIKAVYSILGFLLPIYAIVSGIRIYRDREAGGFVSLGRCVLIGLMAGLVAGAIGAVFFIFYTNVIDASYTEHMSEMVEEQWEAQGMTEEQIEQARSFSGFMFNPFLLAVFQIIGSLIIGTIIGLIAGAFLKRESPREV